RALLTTPPSLRRWGQFLAPRSAARYAAPTTPPDQRSARAGRCSPRARAPGVSTRRGRRGPCWPGDGLSPHRGPTGRRWSFGAHNGEGFVWVGDHHFATTARAEASEIEASLIHAEVVDKNLEGASGLVVDYDGAGGDFVSLDGVHFGFLPLAAYTSIIEAAGDVVKPQTEKDPAGLVSS